MRSLRQIRVVVDRIRDSITPSLLNLIGRSLIRSGESLLFIDVDAAGILRFCLLKVTTFRATQRAIAGSIGVTLQGRLERKRNVVHPTAFCISSILFTRQSRG